MGGGECLVDQALMMGLCGSDPAAISKHMELLLQFFGTLNIRQCPGLHEDSIDAPKKLSLFNQLGDMPLMYLMYPSLDSQPEGLGGEKSCL